MSLPNVIHRLPVILVLVVSYAFALRVQAQETESSRAKAGESAQRQNQQPHSGRRTLAGFVADGQGRGISGASVSLHKEGSNRSIDVSSDTNGHFDFSNLTPGKYKVVVSAKGFQSLERQVDLSGEVPSDLVLKLAVAMVQSTVTVRGETDNIVATRSSVGSLTSIPLLDLPQSVQVVNRELLDEQKTYQYADTLIYMSDVQRTYTAIAGGLGNEVAMRGFNLDFNNNYLRDGFKYYGLSLSDTADIESVEVLKGPASALYGTAEAGGVVNLITRKPTESPLVSISMNGGSYRYIRPDFDISGPINSRKTIFYRLNGAYENTQTFRQYADSEKLFLAPYLLWKPNESTTLSLLGEWINVNRRSDYGTVLLGDRPAPVPVSTSYTEPWNNEDDRDRQGGYRFRHTFNSGWVLNNGFQISRTNARYFEVFTTGPDSTDPTQLTRLSDAFYFPTLYRYSQTSVEGLFKTGPVTHHVAAGFEAGWVTQSSEGPAGYAPNVSVLNPVTGSDFTKSDAAAALANPFFSLTYQSIYHNQSGFVQDQIDLGSHWKAIAGARIENYYQDAINEATNTHQKQTDLPISPRVGVVYKPVSSLSLYGSYVRSFIPTSPGAISAAGKQFSPERDHQWEGGVKFEPGSSRMTMTAALFQIEKNNVLAPDPNNPNSPFSVQNGQERSKGFEFQFQGSPVRGLNLLASYAFVQAQVTKSTQYPVGNLLPNAPRHSGAIWANYQAPGGVLRHLGLNAGLVSTAARQDNFFNTALLPGYARLDLGSYYEFSIAEKQKMRFSINVQNALDRTYYLASNGQDQVRPGSPVSVLTGLSWTWR